jgi:hypothetical protein
MIERLFSPMNRAEEPKHYVVFTQWLGLSSYIVFFLSEIGTTVETPGLNADCLTR